MSSTSKLLNVSIPAPNRSMFDLSRANRSTIAPGLLYPMLVEEILPGDDINLSVEARLKSHATLAPILGMFDCTYYHFFCPLRNYVADMNLNIKQTDFRDEFDLPLIRFRSLNVGNDSDRVISVGAGSLLDYLGFPVNMSNKFKLENSTFPVNYFNGIPLLCYFDIWRNYFANPQADRVPFYQGFAYNSITDTLVNSYSFANVSAFDDLFKNILTGGVTVNTAFDESFINITFEDVFFNRSTVQFDTPEMRDRMNAYSSHAGLLPVTYHDDMFVSRLSTSYVDYVKSQVVVDTSSGSFSIDSLRMANKLAKFIDKSIFGGTRYGQWLKSHFAVNGMEHLNIPIFLGMDRMSLFFDDVVSQSNTEQGDNGFLGSTGGRASVHYPTTNKVEFYAKEHGYLMTLVALRPRVEYFQGLPKMYQKTKFSDIYVPELDAVGWQPILSKDLYANTMVTAKENRTNSYQNPDAIVGYSPAWIEYMTAVGSAHGQFVSTLDYWVLLRRFVSETNDDSFVSVDFSTYVDPQDYNYAFAGTDDTVDNFYLNQLFNLYIGRNISKQILPSL